MSSSSTVFTEQPKPRSVSDADHQPVSTTDPMPPVSEKPVTMAAQADEISAKAETARAEVQSVADEQSQALRLRWGPHYGKLKAATVFLCVLCLVSLGLLAGVVASRNLYTYVWTLDARTDAGKLGPLSYDQCTTDCYYQQQGTHSQCDVRCDGTTAGSRFYGSPPMWAVVVIFVLAALVTAAIAAVLVIARLWRFTRPHQKHAYKPTWDRVTLAVLALHTAVLLAAIVIVATFDASSNLIPQYAYGHTNAASMSLGSGFDILIAALVLAVLASVGYSVLYRLKVLRALYEATGTLDVQVTQKGDRMPAGFWASHIFQRYFYFVYGVVPSIAAFAVLVNTLISTALFNAILINRSSPQSDPALLAVGPFTYTLCHGQCSTKGDTLWKGTQNVWTAFQAFVVLSTMLTSCGAISLLVRFVQLMRGRSRQALYSSKWDRRLLGLWIATLVIDIVTVALYQSIDIGSYDIGNFYDVQAYTQGGSNGMILFAAIWSLAVVVWFSLALRCDVFRGIVCPHPAWAKGWYDPIQVYVANGQVAYSPASPVFVQPQLQTQPGMQIVLNAGPDPVAFAAQLQAMQAAYPQATIIVNTGAVPSAQPTAVVGGIAQQPCHQSYPPQHYQQQQQPMQPQQYQQQYQQPYPPSQYQQQALMQPPYQQQPAQQMYQQAYSQPYPQPYPQPYVQSNRECRDCD